MAAHVSPCRAVACRIVVLWFPQRTQGAHSLEPRYMRNISMP